MSQTPHSIQTFLLHDDGRFPNHPHWPLILYSGGVSLSRRDPAKSIERAFAQNGWKGIWRNGIYTFHHYHSNAHEVLGVYSGKARVQFGGPQGVVVDLKPGDVAVLPAGTGHCNLDSSADLGVVGAYPSEMSYDVCRGEAGERTIAMENIPKVPRPKADPVFGIEGGLLEHWNAADQD